MDKNNKFWEKLNDLTGKVTVYYKKKNRIPMLLSLLFIALLIPLTYFGSMFVMSVLKYDDVEVHGPEIDYELGKLFKIDFSKTEMMDVKKDQTPMEITTITNIENHVDMLQMRDPSLRLQYAYNDIFQRAGADFIVHHMFYGMQYRDASKIQILDVYTDQYGTNRLNLEDVSTNNYDILTNILYLQIRYDNRKDPEPTLIKMPTMFIGQEGFYSKFIQFKGLEERTVDEANSVLWENQTTSVGRNANGIILDQPATNEQIYTSYHGLFNAFYEENNDGYDEFSAMHTNPYEHFVISGVNENDSLYIDNIDNSYKINDYDDLLDLNSLFNISASPSQQKDILEKIIWDILIFAKNIYNTDDIKIPDMTNIFNKLTNTNNKELNQYKEFDPNDEFYFVFYQESFDFEAMWDSLEGYVKDVLAGKKTTEDILDEIKKEIILNGPSEQFPWLSDIKYLPFQTYTTVEEPDYSLRNYRFQQNAQLPTDTEPSNVNFDIDKPALHKVGVKGKSNTELNEVDKITKIISDYWINTTYQMDISKTDPELVECLKTSITSFLSMYGIINSDYVANISTSNTQVIKLNNQHKPPLEGEEIAYIHFKVTIKGSEVKNLKSITFRFISDKYK